MENCFCRMSHSPRPFQLRDSTLALSMQRSVGISRWLTSRAASRDSLALSVSIACETSTLPAALLDVCRTSRSKRSWCVKNTRIVSCCARDEGGSFEAALSPAYPILLVAELGGSSRESCRRQESGCRRRLSCVVPVNSDQVDKLGFVAHLSMANSYSCGDGRLVQPSTML